MDAQKMQALYGLKWNPFSPDAPTEGLYRTAKIESFCHRVESLVLDGGFAMISGDPGTGKSAALRLLEERLMQVRDLTVGTLIRPQSGLMDFYREIGGLFGLSWSVNNRWSNFKSLRDKWQSHIEATLLRPVLLIDEAQETPSLVLSELRLLSSLQFDSRSILTVVLAGDSRLPERFRSPHLHPLGTRIRARLKMEPAGRDEMIQVLTQRLAVAGNPSLMTPGLIETLVDHSAGNHRILLHMADEVFAKGIEKDARQLDEKIYLEIYQPQEPRSRKPAASRRA